MTNIIAIPQEFQTLLRPTSRPTDPRSDEDILTSLTKYRPVTSEKNVWGFWDSGILKMKPWLKRNVVQWVRVHEPAGWTVRILDSVPQSENYALAYLSPDALPKAFVEGTMDGKFRGQHSADFMRAPLLHMHGGAYMDVSIIPFMTVDHLVWDKLLDDSNPFRICAPLGFNPGVINYAVVARKGDPFVQRWHEIFFKVWQGRTNSDGLRFDDLLAPAHAILKKHLTDTVPVMLGNLKKDIDLDELNEYGAQISAWTRLACIQEPGERGFDGVAYWNEKIALLDMETETSLAEVMQGANGERIFKLLSLDRGEDSKNTNPGDWTAANQLVWSLLSKSAFMKVGKAASFTDIRMLGNVLDGPENLGADAAPGTFFDLLRYGVEHFEQTRDGPRFIPAPQPPVILAKDVLEP